MDYTAVRMPIFDPNTPNDDGVAGAQLPTKAGDVEPNTPNGLTTSPPLKDGDNTTRSRDGTLSGLHPGFPVMFSVLSYSSKHTTNVFGRRGFHYKVTIS